FVANTAFLRCIARTVRTQNTWDDRHQNGLLRPAGPLPMCTSSCIRSSCVSLSGARSPSLATCFKDPAQIGSFHIMVCLSEVHFTAGQQGGVPHCIGGCIVNDRSEEH